MNPIEIALSLAVYTLIVGSIINWWISSHFSKKTAKEMSKAMMPAPKDVNEQKQFEALAIRFIEAKEGLSVNYNDEGEPIGINLTVECDTAKLGMTGHVGSVTVATGDQSS